MLNKLLENFETSTYWEADGYYADELRKHFTDADKERMLEIVQKFKHIKGTHCATVLTGMAKAHTDTGIVSDGWAEADLDIFDKYLKDWDTNITHACGDNIVQAHFEDLGYKRVRNMYDTKVWAEMKGTLFMQSETALTYMADLEDYIVTEIDKLDLYEGRYEADELFTDKALNSYKVIEETV